MLRPCLYEHSSAAMLMICCCLRCTGAQALPWPDGAAMLVEDISLVRGMVFRRGGLVLIMVIH